MPAASVQIALAYEPFELRCSRPPLRLVDAPLESMLERVPSDLRLGSRLAEWKALRNDGWEVHALLAPDAKTVVLIACRGGETR